MHSHRIVSQGEGDAACCVRAWLRATHCQRNERKEGCLFQPPIRASAFFLRAEVTGCVGQMLSKSHSQPNRLYCACWLMLIVTVCTIIQKHCENPDTANILFGRHYGIEISQAYRAIRSPQCLPCYEQNTSQPK